MENNLHDLEAIVAEHRKLRDQCPCLLCDLSRSVTDANLRSECFKIFSELTRAGDIKSLHSDFLQRLRQYPETRAFRLRMFDEE